MAASVTLNPALSMRIPQPVLDAARRVGEEGKAVLAPTAVADAYTQIGKGAVKGDLNAVKAGAQAALPSLLKAGRNGGIFAAAVSLVENTWKVFKHERSVAQAGGLIVADTAIGACGGVAAASLSGLGMAALGAVGLAGLPLTIIGGALGIAGYYLVDRLAKNTGIYKQLSDNVSSKLAAMPATQRLQQAVN